MPEGDASVTAVGTDPDRVAIRRVGAQFACHFQIDHRCKYGVFAQRRHANDFPYRLAAAVARGEQPCPRRELCGRFTAAQTGFHLTPIFKSRDDFLTRVTAFVEAHHAKTVEIELLWQEALAAGALNPGQRKRGVIGPPGMPAENIVYWEDLFARLNRTASWKKYLADNQFQDGYMGSTALARFLEEFTVSMRDLLKDAGVKVVR
jgi:hypothetical protein